MYAFSQGSSHFARELPASSTKKVQSLDDRKVGNLDSIDVSLSILIYSTVQAGTRRIDRHVNALLNKRLVEVVVGKDGPPVLKGRPIPGRYAKQFHPSDIPVLSRGL